MLRNPKVMQDSIDNSKQEHCDLIKNLYEKWTEWDDNAFNGFFSGRKQFPSIRIERLAEKGALGKFLCPKNKQTYRYPTIILSEAVFTGEQEDFNEGDEYSYGRFLFLVDLLLHEMIHHFIAIRRCSALSKQEMEDMKFDEQKAEELDYAPQHADIRHGMEYTRKANEIAKKLKLRPVGCRHPSEDLEGIAYGGRWSKYFPMCCKSRKDYKEAYLGTEYCSA